MLKQKLSVILPLGLVQNFGSEAQNLTELWNLFFVFTSRAHPVVVSSLAMKFRLPRTVTPLALNGSKKVTVVGGHGFYSVL